MGHDDVCVCPVLERAKAKVVKVERAQAPSTKGRREWLSRYHANPSGIYTYFNMAAFRGEGYDPRYAQVADRVRYYFDKSKRVEFESEACGGGACGTLFRVRHNGKRFAVKVVLEAFFDDGNSTRPGVVTRSASRAGAGGSGDGVTGGSDDNNGDEEYNSDEDSGWVDDKDVDDKLGQIQNEFFWLGVRRRSAAPGHFLSSIGHPSTYLPTEKPD